MASTRSTVWLFVVAAGIVVTLSAQGPAPAFEVASVKRAEPGIQGGRVQFPPGGRFSAENVPIDFIVQQVYGLRDFQVIVPAQLKAAIAVRYQIQAQGPESASQDQLREMAKTLLANRFQLRTHRETRDFSVYALVIGKGGVKGARAPDGKGGGIMLMARGWSRGQGIAAGRLAEYLSSLVDRPVIDRTNLTQVVDFDLAWTPEGTAGDLPGCPESFQEMAKRLKGAVVPTSCPALFTAVQEQLGLRLEAQQGPVDVLVIDSVQPPTEN